MSIGAIIDLILRAKRKKEMIPIVMTETTGKELSNHVALITGGSGGIGFAIAKKFLACGCKTIIAGTNEEKLAKLANEINNENLKTICINYNDVKQFESKVEEANNIFGNIDIFVSSSGIHVDRKGMDFPNITEEEFDSVIDVNLKGTYFMCQKISNYMIKHNVKGHILVISSQLALEPSWSPYRLSKNGVDSMIKGMASSLLDKNIVVNGIGPGPTATSMRKEYHGHDLYTEDSPIYRLTAPEEVAEYAKILVSDLGNTVVGQTIYLSGGGGIIEISR